MTENDVLKFDVPVDDVTLVHVIDPFKDFSYDNRSWFLFKAPALSKMIN